MQVLFNGQDPPLPWPDPAMGALVARYAAFCADDLGELMVILVEPGDTMQALDAPSHNQFSFDPWSDKRLGDAGFVPPFETLHEHAGFYEVTFIQGDGFSCTLVLIPKSAGIDAAILSLCSAHATPAPALPA